MSVDKDELVSRIAAALAVAILEVDRGHFELDGTFLYCSDANRGFDVAVIARKVLDECAI